MAKKKRSSSNSQEVRNAAKTLFANIRFMSVDNPIRSVAITSTVSSEGKTATAVQLGQAIATSGKSCLLVEADMRRRSLYNVLGVHSQAGIYSVLADATPLSRAVTATKTPNLYMIDVEPNIPNPADILASKRYRRLAESLRKRFDYVVYDTPPVGTFVDAAILSTMVDGVVMVVRPGAAKRSNLLDAYDQLERAGANVLGICATFCENMGSEYYYAYYTRDGKRVKNHTHRGDRKLEAPPDIAGAAFLEDEPEAGVGGVVGVGGAGGVDRASAGVGAGMEAPHADEPDLRMHVIPNIEADDAQLGSGPADYGGR